MFVQVIGCRGIKTIEGGIERHVEHLYSNTSNFDRVELLLRKPYYNKSIDGHWENARVRWIWSPQSKTLETIVHSFIATLIAGWDRPDILHIHGIGPALFTPLARLLGLRVVLTHHGFDYEREKWGWFAKSVLRIGEHLGCRFANEVICVSETIKSRVSPSLTKRAYVIYNGVNQPVKREPGAIIRKFRLKPRKYVLQVSRFVPEKRQLDLIYAFLKQDRANWGLVFTGDSSGHDDYMNRIKELAANHPNIILTGTLSGRDLDEIYSNAGLFVLPSSHEGLPIVILEAMSFGLPVIASDIAPNIETGLPADAYFSLGDLDAIDNALTQEMALEWDERQAASRRERMINEFSWQSIAALTEEVLMQADHSADPK